MSRLLFIALTCLGAPAFAQEGPDQEADEVAETEVAPGWVSSIRTEGTELFVTGLAPEGTRVIVVVGSDGYGGETTADADGTWSLTTPARTDASIVVVRTDTGDRYVLREAAVEMPSPPSAIVERIMFSVDPTKPVRAGDVLSGMAMPREEIVVKDAAGMFIATTRANELGRWQVLLETTDTEFFVVAPSSEPEEAVRVPVLVERPPLVIDAPDLIIQPQNVMIITAPKRTVKVLVDGQERGTATSDGDGYVVVKAVDYEPGDHVFEAIVDPGEVSEVRDRKQLRVLNRARVSGLVQVGGYLAGGAAGGLVGGLAGFGLDGGSLQPSSEEHPSLAQVGIAFGSAIGGPAGLHWVTRRADVYKNPLGAFAGSLVVVGGYYMLVPFLRGPASWYGSMFVAGFAAPLASIVTYNLTPAPRRALRKRHAMRWTVVATPTAVGVGARW